MRWRGLRLRIAAGARDGPCDREVEREIDGQIARHIDRCSATGARDGPCDRVRGRVRTRDRVRAWVWVRVRVRARVRASLLPRLECARELLPRVRVGACRGRPCALGRLGFIEVEAPQLLQRLVGVRGW